MTFFIYNAKHYENGVSPPSFLSGFDNHAAVWRVGDVN